MSAKRMIVILSLLGLSVSPAMTQVRIDAALKAVPEKYEGSCPAVIKFSGKIVVSRACNLSYRFVRSDGAKSQTYELFFKEPGDQPVEDEWRLNGDFSGWVAIEVLSPGNVFSNKANFTVKCRRSLTASPIPLKPDLVIESVRVEKVSQEPADTTPVRMKLKMTVSVKNVSGISTANSLTNEGTQRACGGSFKVNLEGMDYPSGTYRQLTSWGVQALEGGQSRTLTYEEWLPWGASRKYRTTADFLDWIAESREGNNSGSAGYGIR